MYANRIAQTIGSYFVQLGRVDAIVFTGGVGENDGKVRSGIIDKVKTALNIDFDDNANLARAEEKCLSTPTSKVAVWMIPTNEELVIAQDTVRILGL